MYGYEQVPAIVAHTSTKRERAAKRCQCGENYCRKLLFYKSSPFNTKFVIIIPLTTRVVNKCKLIFLPHKVPFINLSFIIQTNNLIVYIIRILPKW